MAQHLADRGEVPDELEGHLRDELEALMRAGHPPTGALAIAMTRLGPPSAIAAEFAKVPPLAAPWRRSPPRRDVADAAPAQAPGGGLTSLLAVHMGAVMAVATCLLDLSILRGEVPLHDIGAVGPPRLTLPQVLQQETDLRGAPEHG
ncbi:MAG: hypothetical protein IRY99_15105 [Isosphaeraceae bacterium]|nr:hypothetical protein [Isosphaeraceae bacterium]